MARLGDFEAFIVVDGTTLPEHCAIATRNGLKTGCVVQSEKGKTFMLRWKDMTRSHRAWGRVFVDGEHAASRVFNGDFEEVVCKGFCDGGSGHAEFCFGQVEFTDDGSLALADDEAFGTIELFIETGDWNDDPGSVHCDDEGISAENDDDDPADDNDPDWVPPGLSSQRTGSIDEMKEEGEEPGIPGNLNTPSSSSSKGASNSSNTSSSVRDEEYLKPVYEMNKKGCDHRVEAGALIDDQEDYYDFQPDGSPPWHFVFKYRSRARLLAEGIIPPKEESADTDQSSSPDSKRGVKRKSVKQDNDSEDDDSEMKELKAQRAVVNVCISFGDQLG
ncbi:hypothetical protein CALVIDRAFT_386892 [Calocera viscosa TUFC12733]|uniref:Uncharacterized protein n=1 Tax=Calocera viscosa (strain TUFC12733) TaxID=1330018 RepID=A0A167GKY7_CALVF|nr:hypothetical protein CALVIDRAFT_386892 [Calocera viscosa TUFC12733]